MTTTKVPTKKDLVIGGTALFLILGLGGLVTRNTVIMLTTPDSTLAQVEEVKVVEEVSAPVMTREEAMNEMCEAAKDYSAIKGATPEQIAYEIKQYAITLHGKAGDYAMVSELIAKGNSCL